MGETSSLASLTAPASFVNQTNGAGSSSSGSGSNSHLHNNADHIPEDHQHIQLDEEIDPALRAIVNSLTNAQQVSRLASRASSGTIQLWRWITDTPDQ